MAICNPGAIAVGWIAGTCEVGLRNGASQHLMDFMLTDLEASGSTGMTWRGPIFRKHRIREDELGRRASGATPC